MRRGLPWRSPGFQLALRSNLLTIARGSVQQRISQRKRRLSGCPRGEIVPGNPHLQRPVRFRSLMEGYLSGSGTVPTFQLERAGMDNLGIPHLGRRRYLPPGMFARILSERPSVAKLLDIDYVIFCCSPSAQVRRVRQKPGAPTACFASSPNWVVP